MPAHELRSGIRVPRRSGGLYIGRPAPALLEALELFRCARLAGASQERMSRMRCSAYLVIPAPVTDETRSRTVIEAFASALPVIAARCEELAALVEPGRNGLFFEPGSARELARKLAWAEAFPERMRRMGECAKADYEARFLPDWSHPRLFGERRRLPRHAG